MQSHEDRVAASEEVEHLAAIGAARVLRTIPGVLHVSVGHNKRRGGELRMNCPSAWVSGAHADLGKKAVYGSR
jgi:hypothetical protein